MLANQQPLSERPMVRLTTVQGEGLLKGIDLDDSSSLLEFLEANRDDSAPA